MNARFVLVRVRNSLNIGAVARALANFGFADLAAVEPYEPRWREAQSAAGAAELLRRAPVLSLEEALADRDLVLGAASAHGRRREHPVVPLSGLAAWLRRLRPPRRRPAVLFGSEKTGLSNRELDRCHALLEIPTSPEVPSMNLGQAAAVIAYELSRARLPTAPVSPERRAPEAAQLELLADAFLAVMERTGAGRHMRAATRRAFLRRALRRWALTGGDAAFLQGLFRRLSRE